MSSSDPGLSFQEAMKRELSRYKNVIVEKEKRETEVKGERDLLKKEVEEMRSKMMESHQTSLLNKSILQELEQTVLKANAALALPPPTGFSSKGRTTADRFRPKEACNSGATIDKRVNQGETPVARDVTFNLTRCCDLNIINRIEKHLPSESLERFEKSCFGHFLNLNYLEYQGHVVLLLLMHMDMAASSIERLVFRINNSVIEFGPKDFSLITGLRLGEFGPMIETPPPPSASSSSILRDVFKNRSTILVKHVKAAFLAASRVSEGGGERALKLAILYFLHGTLLSNNPLKKIDLKYCSLVDDLDRFNEFPWGQLVFEFLASFMLSARRLMDLSNASHKRLPKQCMLGFSFALQIWAYETMPSLAEFCEARVIRPENTPRILRWSATKIRVRFEHLKPFFETHEGPSMLQGIGASPLELEKLSRETTIRRVKAEKTEVCDAAKPSSSTVSAEVITISDDEDDDDENRRKKRSSCEETQQTVAPAS